MNIIEVILFSVIVVFAVILLFAKINGKPKPAPVNENTPDQRSVSERIYATFYDWASSLFGVLLFVFVFRSFVFEPFRIPSGSMVPTLLSGDFVAVKKWSYGVRLPIVHKKVLDLGEPERGDVVVFRYPPQPSQNYIKRLVGLPGDTIRYVDKKLTVNGEALPYEPSDVKIDDDAEVFFEDLGGKHHLMQNTLGRTSQSFEVKIPDGQYFMMGDNRDNSSDSRFWGFVPDANLVGRAVSIWISFSRDFPFVRLGRIGGIE